MEFDYLFTMTFSEEGYGNAGMKVTNPDGFKVNNCQLANKTAFGILLQATTTAGNSGPTHIYGNSEGPMCGLRTERGTDNADQFIDNLYVQMSVLTGGPNGVTVGRTNNVDQYRHCIWLDHARNVTIDNSYYVTRNEDFTAVGGTINSNYCINIESTCRDVRYNKSRFDHTSTLQWVRDNQVRPSAQASARMMFDTHVVATNYTIGVGITGGSATVEANPYSYNREALQNEIITHPRAVEFAVVGTITGVSTNSATLGVNDSAVVGVATGTPWIMSSNPVVRRFLSWPVTPQTAVGTIVRGTIMVPVDTNRLWRFNAFNPTNWTSTWTLTPIGLEY
jgi:hypothetical protein